MMGDILCGIGFVLMLIGCAGMDSEPMTVPMWIVGVGMLLVLIGVVLGSITVERGDEYDDL